MCIGNVKEWETEIIPQELTPEYGREWPLGAKSTFKIAMWLITTERYRLPGGGKRRWGPPPGVALEPLACVGDHLDEQLAAGPAELMDHDYCFHDNKTHA